MTGVIKAAVIGHPVAHSKSPRIHSYWIKKYGMRGEYGALDVPPDDLGKRLRRLAGEGYAGFNITVPHKEKALALCDETDETARAIGAVNTIAVKNEKLFGTNTDAFGFIENIRESAPEFDFAGGPALVLGAGGAARGLVYGLLRDKAPRLYVLNRTRAKAELLKKDFPAIEIADWEDRNDVLKEAHLLVNATSLGMTGQPPLDLNLEKLNPRALVSDIVYAPLETDLLRCAAARGNPVVTGIGMLLHQARPGFRAWFGIMPDIDEELRRLVLA